jgi:S-adenosylmethionine-diacylgycerolhomoserine-N-methlytransferase
LAVSSVRDFYRRQARIYDLTRWTFLFGRTEAIRALALRPEHRVLEVGCGTGLNFHRIADLLDPSRGRLTGIDSSPEMLRRARERVRREGWRHVDLLEVETEIPGETASFDAVLFSYSLSMMARPDRVLETAHRLLRPGGRLVVLDFGSFRGWGPIGMLLRAWMRRHRVDVTHAYADDMGGLFASVRVRALFAGYCFVAVGTDRGNP